MPDIVTSAPPVLILICLLSGVAVAAMLYYRERRSELSSGIRWFLAIMRFMAWSALAFLLLGPVIRAWTRTTEKPIVVVLADNSLSMKLSDSGDAGFYDQLASITSSLPSGVEVVNYVFDDEVRPGLPGSPEGYHTDIGGALNYISEIYNNRNLGAVILATDGINNSGTDPMAAARTLNAPVFTLAWGDTSVRRDIRVARVEHNRIAFLGNKFPLRINIRADLSEGMNTTMELRHEGRLMHREAIKVNSQDFYLSRTIEIEATQPGLQRYTVSLSSLEGEYNLGNNRASVYVEVLDASRKVLILAGAPHPDITAMRQAIESTEQVQTDVVIISQQRPEISGYNLLILYQLPSTSQRADDLVKKARDSGIPIMFVLGTSSDVIAFDRLSLPLKVQGAAGKFNQVTGMRNPDFPLFHSDELLVADLADLPPLQAPFGELSHARDMEILLSQRIGRVDSRKPLLAFHDMEGWKTGYIAGEGLWGWRGSLYRKHGSHEVFNVLITSMVKYLSLREERARFRIRHENRYLQSERITIGAELYNAAYEPDNGRDISLILFDSAGTAYSYAFTSDERGYSLELGYLAPGNYRFRATVNGMEPVSGMFVVEEVNVESARLRADFDLLRNISSISGAQALIPDRWNELAEMLNAREDIRPVVYSHQRYTDLTNWPWFLGLLLMLLSVEWIIRRLGGSY